MSQLQRFVLVFFLAHKTIKDQSTKTMKRITTGIRLHFHPVFTCVMTCCILAFSVGVNAKEQQS